MTYLVHLLSPSYWVRSELPALATAKKHPAGNLRQLMREQVGRYDIKLQDIYGMVARIKAPFSVRRFLLLLSDATALLRSRTG
jgi:hypothetical protein